MVEKQGLDSVVLEDPNVGVPGKGALFLVPGGVKGSRTTGESIDKVSAAVKRYAQSHMRMGRQPEDEILLGSQPFSQLHPADTTRSLSHFSEKGAPGPRVGRLK